MNADTLRFLRTTYKEYYFRNPEGIEFPTKMEEREFGYTPFGGTMVRHLSFKNPGELIAEIVRQAPSSIYSSNAFYDVPTLPMEEKGWKGAELIFDIDANDIPTDCKKKHDVWYCEECGTNARIPRPARCPKCEGANTVELHNVCDVCLGAAKSHLLRLVAFLTEDFGVIRENIKAYFSGNRGYHLHVYDARFNRLNSAARGDISEYLRGSGTAFSQVFLASLKRALAQGPGSEEDYGWARRLSKYVLSADKDNSPIKSPKKNITQRVIDESVKSQAARIDPSVTTDIHRVFRMAGTLHGTSGMLKMRVDPQDSFDPRSDPVVLPDDRASIRVKFSPEFKLKGMKFGPFESENVIIPTFAAVYMLARGLGEVA
ncbi:MAG: hypothetical protein OK422_03165 [Thaumarchaeota archaeon]|nr:hypothetical protein [Nitrososphaerota archaeon]